MQFGSYLVASPETSYDPKDPTIRLPVGSDFQLAVALMPTELWSHAGIAFVDDATGRAVVLDLAWHFLLTRAPLAPEYALCISSARPEVAEQIITFCELLWIRAQKVQIPYGLAQDGVSFDE